MSALMLVTQRLRRSRLDYAQHLAKQPRSSQQGGTHAGYNAARGEQLIRTAAGDAIAVRTTSNGAVPVGTPQTFNLPQHTLPRTDSMPR